MKGHEGGGVNPATRWNYPRCVKQCATPFIQIFRAGPWHLYYLSSRWFHCGARKRELERQAGPAFADLEFGGCAQVLCKPQNLTLT